jgi:hypothetical protein
MSTVVLIQESLPHEWFKRNSYGSQKILFLQWLVFGCLLSMAYKYHMANAVLRIKHLSTLQGPSKFCKIG